VKFRWRLGTDTIIGKDGWYIDDVNVYSCGVTQDTPTDDSIGVGSLIMIIMSNLQGYEKMNFNKLLIGIILMGFGFPSVAVEPTESVKLSKINVNAKGNRIYFRTESPSGWGIKSCPNATYVFIDYSESASYKALYSTALAAKLTGQPVSFTGDCISSQYFKAFYVVL